MLSSMKFYSQTLRPASVPHRHWQADLRHSSSGQLVTHRSLGATVSDPEAENMGKKGVRREWWKEGWETRSTECVRACGNADDGQECWKAASNKNLSRDDSSVSMCPLRDDGSVLLLLGDLSLQWRNHQLRLVGLNEHAVKVRPNKHGPLAYVAAKSLDIEKKKKKKLLQTTGSVSCPGFCNQFWRAAVQTIYQHF